MASSDANTNETENDLGEPLDTLQMRVNSKNGIQTMVSALHIGFMETRSYIQFTTPPLLIDDTGQGSLTADEEEWLEGAAFLEEDLHWMLRLPHNRFWSQVVYDENLHRCLESYLSQAPRDYDLVNLRMKDEVLCSLKQIHKLVFLVYLRMSTYKESKKHHITPEGFGTYIYDNFLFDVPKLMDICALYGFQNQQIIQKMIFNIFSTQPKYIEDLNKTSTVILEVFNTIEEKLSTHSHERKHSSDKEVVNRLSVRKEISVLPFHDVVNYITDVSATLHAFLEIYPPACEAFYQNDGAIRLATFYEQAFSMIEKEISIRKKQQKYESLLEKVQRKMTLSKTLLIKIFRNILSHCCIDLVLHSSSSNSSKKVCENPHVEHFLEIFTMLASEKSFLHDYNALYPFESDVELFSEFGLKLEPERLSYIFCSIHETEEEFPPENFTSSVVNGARPKTKRQNDGIVHTLQSAAALLKESPSKKNGQSLNFSSYIFEDVESNGLSECEISSHIQSVLDVLPELGDGFIEKCLQHFEFDAERVIDAILSENTLPGHLNDLDRNLKRVSNSETRINSTNSILSERKNIHDHDEFDLFNRDDVDLSNIHIGKKNKTPLSYETLQNSEESEFLKELTLKFGYDDQESDSELNLYEDDYDDTYDSAMVGLKEPAPEGQPDDAENDEGELDSSEPSRDTSKDFCINPEISRERAEQRRQTKMAARSGGRRVGPPPSDDAHGRQQKDRHKGRVGNHNRRSQADFKRSRGMGALPSR